MELDELLRPLSDDPLRPPEEVAREVLGTAKNRRTYTRAITVGIIIGQARGVKGRVVKLRAIRTGLAWETTKRAFLAYLAELNAETSTPAPPSGRSPVKRRRSSERAAEKLKTMGV
jgi:hypothetical protein